MSDIFATWENQAPSKGYRKKLNDMTIPELKAELGRLVAKLAKLNRDRPTDHNFAVVKTTYDGFDSDDDISDFLW